MIASSAPFETTSAKRAAQTQFGVRAGTGEIERYESLMGRAIRCEAERPWNVSISCFDFDFLAATTNPPKPNVESRLIPAAARHDGRGEKPIVRNRLKTYVRR